MANLHDFAGFVFMLHLTLSKHPRFSGACNLFKMSTTTRLTLAEFDRLPEKEGTRYELDEGTLLMEPSPALRHSLVRQRIAEQLTQLVPPHHRAGVVEGLDFRPGT